VSAVNAISPMSRSTSLLAPARLEILRPAEMQAKDFAGFANRQVQDKGQ
jgi:hypothetical protein